MYRILNKFDKLNSKYLVYFYVIGALLMINGNAVFSGNLLQTIHPYTLLFWSSFSAIIFFVFQLSISKGFNALKFSYSSFPKLISLNVFSSISWIGYYYALKYIEPAITSAIMGGIGPLFMVIFSFITIKYLSTTQVTTSIGILLGVLVLFWGSITNKSGLNDLMLADIGIGFIAATIGGVGQVMTTVSSKRLGSEGWSPSKIMAHRFYFLAIIVFILALNGPGIEVHSTSLVRGIFIASFFGVIIPLWLLQKGISASSPFTISVLLSLGPIITFVFQGFDSRLIWSNFSMIGCLIIVITSIYNIMNEIK